MSVKRDGVYKRGSVWWLRTDPVTGKPLSTRCKDLEAARRFRAKRERLAADPAHAAAETARLDEWIRRVIAVKEADGSAKATVEVYRTKLGHWLRLAPDAMLSEVTPPFVDAFVAQRRTEDVTDHTISKEVTHLCTVLKAAKRAGCYPGDIATLRPPGLSAGYKPRKRALTREEVVSLMGELKPELAALVAICVALGCRLSEAFRLEATDIGPTSVHIRGTKTDESDRHVPVLSIFAALFAVGARQLPLGSEPNNLRRDLAAACARAGIPSASPNDFRRTHATLLAEAGVDRDVTRRLLGHTTTRLVDTVYGQPTTEALGALAEAKLLTAAPLHKKDDAGPLSSTHPRPKTAHLQHKVGLEPIPTQKGEVSNGKEANGSGRDTRAQDRGNESGLDAHRLGPAPQAPGAGCYAGRDHGSADRDSARQAPAEAAVPVAVLQGRDTPVRKASAPTEKHRADFEIRTRDLRFTKPVSPSPDNGICTLRKRFPGLSDGELYRSGAVPPVALLQIRYSEAGAA